MPAAPLTTRQERLPLIVMNTSSRCQVSGTATTVAPTLAGVGLPGARTIVAVMPIAIATDFGDIATGRIGAADLRHNPRPREPDLAHDR